MGAQRVTRIAEVFFTRLFFTPVSSRFSSITRGSTAVRSAFRLSLAGPISFHVLGVLLQPGLLAVLTQRAVERILLQLLAVVIGAAATLAVTGAADHLVRMAAQWLELLAAIRACSDFRDLVGARLHYNWRHDCPTWPTNPKIFQLARVLVDRGANALPEHQIAGRPPSGTRCGCWTSDRATTTQPSAARSVLRPHPHLLRQAARPWRRTHATRRRTQG